MDWNKIKDKLIEHKNLLAIGILALLLGVSCFSKLTNHEEQPIVRQASQKRQATATTPDQTAKTTVTCDISGAVQNQGVYTLKQGARLENLVQAAGGFRHNAQLKAINRALLLKDQDKIHIPYRGEKAAAVGMTTASGTGEDAASGDNQAKINLNTADKTKLQELNGIGEKKAEQIIAYRKEKGDFKKVEDLKEVSGI